MPAERDYGYHVAFLSLIGLRGHNFGDWRNRPALEFARAPDEEERRIQDEFHDYRSDDTADHRCGDALHHISACAVAPHDRNQTADDNSGSHRFRAHSLYRALVNGVAEVGSASHFSFTNPLIVRYLEIKKHDYAGFGTHACEGDQSYPNGYA